MLSRVLSRTRLFLLPALGLTLGLTSAARADASEAFAAQRQAPFPGPLVLADNDPSSSVFSASGISLTAWLPLATFGSHASGNDCWGYVAPSGREYALIGLSDGIAFVEISDPGAPSLITVIATVNSLWRDVKTYEDHAYVVSEGGGAIQVIDMSAIDAGVVSLVGTSSGPGTSASHNIAIDEDSGFLYVIGGGGSPTEGLRIFDLSNKSNPSYVASWNNRYIHDAQIVTYSSGPWSGRQVAFCFSESSSGGGSPGVNILDVTNKGSIQQLSFLSYSNGAYCHQGWLSPDRQYLYFNDELDEATFGTPTTTRVVDVSNLTAPFVASTFTNGLPAIDHNCYTLGNQIFEANYRSGLRIFDASNPTAPFETAFFDTYDQDDSPAFNSLWSVYPYFPSGTVIGSDLEKGLFVWRLGEPTLTFALSGGAPALLNPFGDLLSVTITPQGGAGITPGSATLHLNTGSGFSSVPMSDLGGGLYQGAVPALPCGTAVTYYYSAQDDDGVTWSDPPGGASVLYGSVAALTETLLLATNMETNPGWTVGAPGDSASTGVWTRVDPVGTTAQPEDDHTADPGDTCYVTGQGAVGGSLGDNDVDGGNTTLTSSTFDLSGGDATLSYWRWFSNNTGASPGEDVLTISITNNNGGSWTTVEVVGPTGSDTVGGWIQHSFVAGDFVSPTAQMKLRFVTGDLINGSIVEAAIDDFQVARYDCSAVCQADVGFGGPGNSQFSICGQSLNSGNSATLSLTQAPANALSLLFIGSVLNPVPFKGGLLAPVPFFLDISLFTDGSGQISFPVPGGGGPVTVYGQFAIADPAQLNGVGLSNTLQIDFGM